MNTSVLLTVSINIKGRNFPTKIYRETSMNDALKIKEIFEEISVEIPDLEIKFDINNLDK